MLVKKATGLALTSALIFLCGCSASHSTAVSMIKDGVVISAKLRSISTNSTHQARFVYGELTLNGENKKLKTVNLDCFILTINDVASDAIYVDSIASVLNDRYPADADGKVQVPVYWSYPVDKPLEERDLSSAKLGMKPGISSCFRY
ncbi:hypothetical protein FHW69_003055 [Luteibacter sp. Sphag1AF]|uniref:hypothetical protein n=1 Tax=Luteibacter sp. Sphag1AF TaxID=2587031 RepID=UPI00160C5D9B|nr:hypothetical protein [Luteibacter sp. Sphag1AF]MBB3228420.1 hypothetical protein [Luteibacter sp. Sphag1AF]